MRANEENQTASYSSMQLFNMNFKNSIDKENFTIKGAPAEPFGIGTQDIKAFKRLMNRS